jgi:uncharacterized protein (DUF362 family)
MNGNGSHSMNTEISVYRDGLAVSYPRIAPFDPGEVYPESPFGSRIGSEPNHAYRCARESLRLLELDAPNFGTPAWNPLKALVRPGDHVFLKPNMIAHKHQLNEDWEYVITHGSVIRAVVDYVFIALQGKGKITIGDAPQTDSNFDRIIERMGLPEMQRLYAKEKGCDIALVDLRKEKWLEKDGIYVETVKLAGDPVGSVEVDLAGMSLFAELDGRGKTYYGAYYDVAETNAHHHDGKHEYSISRSPISADVFISIPKLKTHKKCGVTLNLKGLVGINANKNWLPHYIIGPPVLGGDQFEKESAKGRIENELVLKAKKFLREGNPLVQYVSRKTKRLAYKIFGNNENVVRSGNWHGNDTVWRMSLDLNRILLYANEDGTMRDPKSPKRYMSIVDGLIAMEGNGPVAGTPKPCGLVAAGFDPVAVDAACARLMGFDQAKLMLIQRAFEQHRYPLTTADPAALRLVSNVGAWDCRVNELSPDSLLWFKPHFGWTGHVELQPTAGA